MVATVAADVLARGIAFPARAEGRLWSRHRSALNIIVEDSRELVSVVARPDGMTTSSVLVRVTSGPCDLRELVVADRCDVSIRPARLCFGSDLRIELAPSSPVSRYDGRIEPATGMDVASVVDAVVADLVDAICATAPGRGLAPIARLLREPDSGRAADTTAASTCFVNEARRVLAPPPGIPCAGAIDRLVGLGEGLTPSGDDFVVGALAAWSLAGAPPIPDITRARIVASTDETTLPGATVVRQAVRGRYPAYLIRFATEIRIVCAGLAAGRVAGGVLRRRIAAAVRCAANHGHTSGIDAVTGFAFGLTTARS